MRVISGSAKGHKLKTLKNDIARPTTDRVKESLFSIILSNIYGSRVLDLYAGTGNLGIESLSRGATSATFVESNSLCCKIIQQNISSTKFAEKSKLIKSDVLKWLKKPNPFSFKFDLIFMDPPYKDEVLSNTLLLLLESNLMAPDCYLVAESSISYVFSDEIKKLELVRENKYGDTKLSHFTYIAND